MGRGRDGSGPPLARVMGMEPMVLDQAPARASTEFTRAPDGTIRLCSPQTLDAWPRVLTERLAQGAAHHPDRPFLAERQGEGWFTLTWTEGAARVFALAEALLGLGLSAERPIAILSPGSVGHGLLALAATHVGIPYSPLSPGWSLLAKDHQRLDFAFSLLTSGLIYVEDREAFDFALKAPAAKGIPVIDRQDLDRLCQTPVTSAVQAAHLAVDPDSCSRILFTSGSTGVPKGVINTHRMVASNALSISRTFPALQNAPELVSWLPWHHTSGANVILSTLLMNGGSLWIDDGKPLPAAMPRTLENLKGRAPVAYFSAPSGFDLLADGLEADPELAETFLSRLEFFFYSGASLPLPVAERMDRVTRRLIGRRVPFFSCYGSTEMGPFALAVNWPEIRSGLAGLPMPGAKIKLVPSGGLMEVRVSGPGTTPGYWRNPEATKAAFDDEGYYCSGDALAFIDPERPELGLLFDGRIGENFKLSTGTWVNVAGLREALLEAGKGAIREAVIVGEGKDRPGALIYIDPHLTETRQVLAGVLAEMEAKATGSSTCVTRLLILTTPPDAGSGELTDKGSIASRIFRKTRAADVARLFAEPDDPDVITARS